MGGADAPVGRTYPKNEADSEREDIEAEMKVRRVEAIRSCAGCRRHAYRQIKESDR